MLRPDVDLFNSGQLTIDSGQYECFAVNGKVRRFEIVNFCLGWLMATHPTTINCQLSIV